MKRLELNRKNIGNLKKNGIRIESNGIFGFSLTDSFKREKPDTLKLVDYSSRFITIEEICY